MNYEIKVLKAPWPTGAKVGDVIDMPYLPAWAEGKCSVAVDGAKADFTYDPQDVIVGDGTGAALPSIDAINADIEALRQQLTAAQEANDKLTFERAAAEADAKEARQQLTAAQEALAAAQKKK